MEYIMYIYNKTFNFNKFENEQKNTFILAFIWFTQLPVQIIKVVFFKLIENVTTKTAFQLNFIV